MWIRARGRSQASNILLFQSHELNFVFLLYFNNIPPLCPIDGLHRAGQAFEVLSASNDNNLSMK